MHPPSCVVPGPEGTPVKVHLQNGLVNGTTHGEKRGSRMSCDHSSLGD